MKRNPLLICLLMVFAVYISGAAQAQTVQPLPKQEKNKVEFPSTSGTHSKAVIESWFNPYAIFGPNGLNKVSGGSIFTLFPDTTVLIRFTGSQGQDTLDAPFFHSVGNIWDLRADAFVGNPFNIDSTYTYNLDSVAVPYLYTRWNPDPNIVDTLLFQIYWDSAAFTSIRNTGISGNDAALGNLTYNYLTNRGVAAKREIKLPLTSADTAAGLPGTQPGTIQVNKYMFAHVGAMNISGNSRIAVTINYIPGQAYSMAAPYDTLEADSSTVNRLNQFKVLRLNFTEIYKESTSTQLPARNRRYINGLFISSDIRGNNSAGGWNGTYYPGIYSNATTFMDIRIRVTADDHQWGIGMPDVMEGYGLGNAYPNPSNGQDVKLDFKIANSQPVTLTLSNILGQTIKTATENFSAGDHTITVNTSSLETGVYFYTLTSGNFSQTKKLTVTK
jgi:hypothetical protein